MQIWNMDVFRELYDTITEKLGYDDEKWDQFKGSLNSSLRRQFFELFEQGYSEKDIAQKLFRSDLAVAAHRNTKFEIKTALYSELLKFRTSNYQYSPIQQAYYKANQQLTIFKTLRGFGKYASVLDIGTNLLKRSMTYDFTDITVDVSMQLCIFHTEKKLDAEQIEKYADIFRFYSEVQEKEQEIELLWTRMLSLIGDGQKNQKLAVKIGEEYIASHPLPKERIKSFKYNYRYYFIKLYCLELKNDLASFEKVAQEAFNHFCNLPYEYSTGKIAFLHQLIDVKLKLNKITDALKYIDIANEISKKGGSNWFIYIHLKLRAQLSIGAYAEASDTYNSMIEHRNFDHQPITHKNRWILLGTYIQFLRGIDLIPGEKPSTQFINKHLKYLQNHHDELGDLKVLHIIVELLFDVYNRDYDSIESKIYALKGYCNTYLKKSSPNYRSSCFIKMLLLVPQNNFHPKIIERRVDIHLKRLKEQAPNINLDRIDEIIPYEKLWSIIIIHLEAPKRARKSGYNQEDWSMGKRS